MPDAERQIDAPGRDRVGRLHEHLDAGAADALHQMRRPLDRHAGIEPDMARRDVGVERGLRHGAGNRRADRRRIDAGSSRSAARAALMPRSIGEISANAPR